MGQTRMPGASRWISAGLLSLLGIAVSGWGLLLILLYRVSVNLGQGSEPTMDARMVLPVGVITVIAGLAVVARLAGAPILVAFAAVVNIYSMLVIAMDDLRRVELDGFVIAMLLIPLIVSGIVALSRNRFGWRPRWWWAACVLGAVAVGWSMVPLLEA